MRSPGAPNSCRQHTAAFPGWWLKKLGSCSKENFDHDVNLHSNKHAWCVGHMDWKFISKCNYSQLSGVEYLLKSWIVIYLVSSTPFRVDERVVSTLLYWTWNGSDPERSHKFGESLKWTVWQPGYKVCISQLFLACNMPPILILHNYIFLTIRTILVCGSLIR